LTEERDVDIIILSGSPLTKHLTRRNVMQSKVIPIFFATDDAYAPLLAVSIRSLLDNADKNYFYRIHILTSSMSNENKKRILALMSENSRITFDDPGKRLERIAGSISLRDYYSAATYYRIFIADMFPSYDKAIYIDSDTVVTGDVSEMFNTEIADSLVGAVHDNVMFIDVFGRYVEKVVDVDRSRYFNAGILLMNLSLFRKEEIELKFIELLERRSFPVAQDQDYLNILCRDRVYYFPYEWNLVPVPELSGREPKIIHFKMALRPWNYDGIEYGEYFWKYAEKTDFYGDLLKTKNSRTELDRIKDEQVGKNLVALAIYEMEATDREKRSQNECPSDPICAF
jgi:lipopolysaccharide biosynthesis glycosyltransferase